MRFSDRRLSSHIQAQKQKVKLTDKLGVMSPKIFESKNALCRYTVKEFPTRKISAWQLKGIGPFTFNNWFIEVINLQK